MRQYEPFKRLFRLIGALLLMGAEVGAYGYVWNGYFNKMNRISVLEKRKLAVDRPVCGTITIFPADLRGCQDRIPEKRKSALFSDPFDRTFKSDYVYSDFSVR